jgi:DNA topoisomerase-2
VRYFELVEKELVIYAKESLHRSIPSLLDGFKPSQRKIMYTLLKTKILEEINVEELTGVVSRHCGYNHGNIVLCEIIIKMAQGFAGKKNITFLLPSAQLGTRDMVREVFYVFPFFFLLFLNLFCFNKCFHVYLITVGINV